MRLSSEYFGGKYLKRPSPLDLHNHRAKVSAPIIVLLCPFVKVFLAL
jgi:hypothetical protein